MSTGWRPERVVQGQKYFAIILAKIRYTAIFDRLYIKLYIKFVANNGKNRDSVHAAISFCPWGGGMKHLLIIFNDLIHLFRKLTI